MMTESISSGKFITVEGVDGCGKTTQAEFIIDGLIEAGLSAKLVREPGGDPISESIRKLLLHAEESMSDRAEALLMIASRAQLTDKVILPQIIEFNYHALLLLHLFFFAERSSCFVILHFWQSKERSLHAFDLYSA